MLAAGAHVVAVYASNDGAATSFATSVAELSANLTLRKADISNAVTCQLIVADTVTKHGRVDHVVNNAGLLEENSLRKDSLEEWDRAISVNLSASFYLAQAAIDVL